MARAWRALRRGRSFRHHITCGSWSRAALGLVMPRLLFCQVLSLCSSRRSGSRLMWSPVDLDGAQQSGNVARREPKTPENNATLLASSDKDEAQAAIA